MSFTGNWSLTFFLYLKQPFFIGIYFYRYKPLWGEDIPDHVPDLIEHIKNSESPRFIKTHLPVELLPKQIWTKKPKVSTTTNNLSIIDM